VLIFKFQLLYFGLLAPVLLCAALANINAEGKSRKSYFTAILYLMTSYVFRYGCNGFIVLDFNQLLLFKASKFRERWIWEGSERAGYHIM